MDRMADPLAIEPGQQVARVGIAQPGLVARRRPELAQGVFGDAARTVAAPREPHRIERGIVGALDQCREALRVAAGEVSVRQKALRMDD
jgi:hypothetical protein